MVIKIVAGGHLKQFLSVLNQKENRRIYSYHLCHLEQSLLSKYFQQQPKLNTYSNPGDEISEKLVDESKEATLTQPLL